MIWGLSGLGGGGPAMTTAHTGAVPAAGLWPGPARPSSGALFPRAALAWGDGNVGMIEKQFFF